MDEKQYEAVVWILERLHKEGREWFRGADLDLATLKKRIPPQYSPFEGREIQTVGRMPNGKFPPKQFLLMTPSKYEKNSILGLWLRWDFNADPFEFRVFVGHWFDVDKESVFNGYRFDAPEKGSEHDFYHCQPCRNFGDKEPIPGAALVSERFPTIPANAGNIVELTVCALMATQGRRRARSFMQKIIQDSNLAGNEHIKQAYLRCCN